MTKARAKKPKRTRRAKKARAPKVTVRKLETAVKLDPRNANLGTDRGREMLGASIRGNGAGRSLLLDRNGQAIAGNKSRDQMLAEGITEVIVVETDGTKAVAVKRMDLELDGEDGRARRLAIADNRVGEVDLNWDADQLLADVNAGMDLDGLWDQRELDAILRGAEGYESPAAPEPEVDRAAELQAKWGTERGQVWEIGRHRLACGDSTVEADVGALLAGATPDGILTDPPYCSGGFQESGKSAGSVGREIAHKHIRNDRLSTRGYIGLLKAAFSRCDAPYLYCFTDWRMWVHLFDIAEGAGFSVRSMIVWDKGTPGMGKGWRSQHELVLWGCKVTPPFGAKHPGMGNVIRLGRTGNELHTTEKPEEMVRAMLRNCFFILSVYDPFLGSGTTMVAAEQNDRTCYGMEIDPGYVAVCLQRMKAMGLEPELEGTK